MKNVMSSKPEKLTSKLLETYMPKSLTWSKKLFRLFSFENAVVKLAAAPRRFPNASAICWLFTP